MIRAIRRYLAALIDPDPAGKVRFYTKGGERNYVHYDGPMVLVDRWDVVVATKLLQGMADDRARPSGPVADQARRVAAKLTLLLYDATEEGDDV